MTKQEIESLARWCEPQFEPQVMELSIAGRRDYDGRRPPCKLVQNCAGSSEKDILWGISELLRRLGTKGRFYGGGPAPRSEDSAVVRYGNLPLTFSSFFDNLHFQEDTNIIVWFYPA